MSSRKRLRLPADTRNGASTGNSERVPVHEPAKQNATDLAQAVFTLLEVTKGSKNSGDLIRTLEQNNHGRANNFGESLPQLFAVEGLSFALQLLGDAADGFTTADASTRLRVTVEAVASLKPKTAVETLLVTQALAVHRHAMSALHRAKSGDDAEQETCINRAERLLKLCVQQIELLAKLQGQISQQRITVEHVEQAAIGVIAGGGGR